MRKILALLVLVVVSSQAHAAESQCVPTKTVEQAKAELDLGYRQLDQQLAAEYQAAQVLLQSTYSNAAAEYKSTVQMIDSKYNQEITQIRRDLNPGWNTEIENAAIRHNESLHQASVNYRVTCDNALALHNQTVETARLKYNHESAALAANYNRAVCAEVKN